MKKEKEKGKKENSFERFSYRLIKMFEIFVSLRNLLCVFEEVSLFENEERIFSLFCRDRRTAHRANVSCIKVI